MGHDTIKLVTVRCAAEILSVSESTVRRLLRSGEVRSVRLRGRRLIPYDALIVLCCPSPSTDLGES